MNITRTVSGLREWRGQIAAQGRTVAFVPTMGFLHEGHLALIREARRSADEVVVSIFVNPLQFGPGEDFGVYPRNEQRDVDLLRNESVDLLFLPATEELFPDGPAAQRTLIEVKGLSERLCGASRPGHFTGVTTIVGKLFHIVQPDIALFGRKDYQQALILQRMVQDLNWPVRVETVATVREADGLAMSSRNSYLNDAERKSALRLYGTLRLFEQLVAGGERDGRVIQEKLKIFLAADPRLRIDYVEIIDPGTLEPLRTLRGEVMLMLAVYIGSTRLIDNCSVFAGQ